MTHATRSPTEAGLHSRLTRRGFLLAIPGVAAVRRIVPWQSRGPVPVSGIHQATLAVADVERSVDFYHGLFGMRVQVRIGNTVLLRIGDGPRFLALTPAVGTPPRIASFGLAVEGLAMDQVAEALAGRVDAQPSGRTLRLIDPDGLVVQLADPGYCGQAECSDPEPSAGPGLLSVRDFSHLTIVVPDPGRSSAFYRETFGLDVQTMQGATPALGVGPGVHFLMFIRGGGAAVEGARIHHVCLGLEGFDLERIQGTLESYGIRPLEAGPGASGPLRHWVSMRMPDRGGAPGGTPELYFSDPDGLAVQLQDVRYCGGGGYLGDEC